MRRVLGGVDDWRLAAVDSLTATGRSLVVAMAVRAARGRRAGGALVTSARMRHSRLKRLLAPTPSLPLLHAQAARGVLGPAAATEAVRAEERFQARVWGVVEGGHDVDEADIAARMAGAISFLHLLELE